MIEDDVAAQRAQVSFQGDQQRMAVDNAGRRRQHGRRTRKLRLQRLRVSGIEPDQIGDAARRGVGGQGVEAVLLGRAGRYDQLAACPMGHTGLAGERIEALLAVDAQAGPQASRRIIEAGVDDLARPAARFAAHAVMAFEQKDLVTREGQGARSREPDDAATHDDGLDIRRVHRRISTRTPAMFSNDSLFGIFYFYQRVGRRSCQVIHSFVQRRARN